MRTPFFYGEHELTIDPKNRLLVPAEIRRRINPEMHGDAFFVTLKNRIPWFYPERFYEDMVNSQIAPGIAPSDELRRWAQLRLSLATRVEWDGQGRVVLSDNLIRRAGLGKKVYMIGLQDHLELWNEEAWLKRSEELLEEEPAIEDIGRWLAEQPKPANK